LASPVQSENQPQAPSRKNKPAESPQTSTVVHMAANSSSIVAEPSGAEDLATAQRYLNGTQGTLRDSREAALWLWKAVGKGNLAATIALSDLYLRGDGVPKSCDQARLLLDAAARKGGTAAAARLRNLQAFGCQ
jgi:TPR repeat protein